MVGGGREGGNKERAEKYHSKDDANVGKIIMAHTDYILLLFINSERNSEGVKSFCVSTGRRYQ